MFPSRINVLSIARLRLHRTFSERTSGIITTKDYDSLPIASTKHAPVLPEWDGGLDEPKLVDRERIEPDIGKKKKNCSAHAQKSDHSCSVQLKEIRSKNYQAHP